MCGGVKAGDDAVVLEVLFRRSGTAPSFLSSPSGGRVRSFVFPLAQPKEKCCLDLRKYY